MFQNTGEKEDSHGHRTSDLECCLQTLTQKTITVEAPS